MGTTTTSRTGAATPQPVSSISTSPAPAPSRSCGRRSPGLATGPLATWSATWRASSFPRLRSTPTRPPRRPSRPRLRRRLQRLQDLLLCRLRRVRLRPRRAPTAVGRRVQTNIASLDTPRIRARIVMECRGVRDRDRHVVVQGRQDLRHQQCGAHMIRLRRRLCHRCRRRRHPRPRHSRAASSLVWTHALRLRLSLAAHITPRTASARTVGQAPPLPGAGSVLTARTAARAARTGRRHRHRHRRLTAASSSAWSRASSTASRRITRASRA